MWRSLSSLRCGLKAYVWGFSLLLVAACSTTAPVTPGATTMQVANTVDPAQLTAAADTATQAGHFPEAARLFVQAAQHSDDEQVIEDAARATYERAQLHAALQITQRWLDINPTSQQAHETAALAALRLYQVEVADQHLNNLLATAYITPASGFLELLPKLDAADSNAAFAVMQRLSEHYPQIAEAHYAVARLAGQTANRQLMLSEAQRAHELSPYWSPAGLLLALAQLNAGQAETALQTAQAVAKDDSSIATQTEYASLLIAAGHTPEAVKLLQELEHADGDASPAIRVLAQIDFQVGNYQAAFARFSRLLNTGKNLSESIYYLGGIAERSGALDEARQLYARVQEGDYALAAQIRLARLIQQQEGMDAALASLQQYGDAKPDELLATVAARAELLAESGDSGGALTLYDQALQSFPDVVSLRLSHAFLLLKMNKTSAALSAMRGLAAERPEDPVVLNALGYTLVDRTRQYKVGREYIAAALQFTPDSGAVLDSMGWALFKLGQKEAALDYLQRAVNRIVDPDLDLHLGEVLWALNRRDDAKQAWQVGLTHAPDNTELQQRLKRAEKSTKGSGKAGHSAAAPAATN